MTASPPKLAAMTRNEVAAIRWQPRPDPVIEPPWPSPVVADPTFLPPSMTPDGSWRLWAHSMIGLHSYRSSDGLAWERGRTVTRNALRAQALAFPGDYYLAYEKTLIFLPVGLPWRSWIELRRSRDLDRWSAPRTLLRPELPWQQNELGRAVSNPCLVPMHDGRWWLYFSGGLTMLPDCGFPEPTAIGVAMADRIEGPYEPLAEPLLGPHDGPADHAAGAMKVLRVADGWVAFQNAITFDGEHSSSAIWVLGSTDGLSWEPLSDRPALAPTGRGWMAEFVYALDVRDTPDGPRMYFNARAGYRWNAGRERIGVATAE